MTAETTLQQHLSANLPFWDDLSDDQKRSLVRATRPLAAQAGDRVQGGGSGCAGVVVALTGSLRAYMLSETGKEITLFRVEPGESCVLAAPASCP